MKRLAVLLTCAIAAHVGCGGDGDDNEVRPVGEYFPLAVGTTWVYGVETGSGTGELEETRTTTGLSSRGGVDWYRIGIIAADGTESEIEVAVTDSSLIRRLPGGGEETVLLRDPVIPGTQWLNELPEIVEEEEDPLADDGTATDPAPDPAAADPGAVVASPAQDGADGDAIDDPTGDAEADPAAEEPRTALYEILSTSDVVVTPSDTYEDVVTVRAFTQGLDVTFYQFAADLGLVRVITETVLEDAPDSPTGSASTTTLELDQFSSEPIVVEDETADAAAGP
ncbi:MAG: hypothetical protein ABGY41_08090 [Candidatus Poribacteria bacterium]